MSAASHEPVMDPADPGPEDPRVLKSAESKVTDLVARAPLAPMEAGTVALTAQVEARIKAQYHLAKLFPRNWTDVRNRMLEAFHRPILAEGAIYSKPIGGKAVEGLSIRFAEEAFRSMGNVIVETFLVSDDEDKRVYTVVGMDMETNASLPVSVVVTKQVERSSIRRDSIILGERLNSKGAKTYILRATSEDDYRSKEQAALQKARRDVILFLIPGDIREECETQIRKTIRDRDAKDPMEAVNRLTQSYHALGVTVAELEKFLGHPVKTINQAELHVLRSVYTGIKEGEGTWEEAMASKLGVNTGADAAGEPVKTAGATAALKSQLAKSPTTAAVASEVPDAITAIRAKPAAKRTDDEQEDLRQFEQDHPGR